MTKILADDRIASVGSETRRLRMSLHLTQQELACMAGVSLRNIRLLEQGWPVQVGCKIKILRELWLRTVNPKSY